MGLTYSDDDRADYVDTMPSTPMPLHAAHAATELGSEDSRQPDGAGVVWAVLIGAIVFGCPLLLWLWLRFAE